MKKWYWIIGLWLLGTFAYGQIHFSGDVTLVSTYVFRGIKQCPGPSLQGTMKLNYKSLSGGLWVSSIGVEEIDTETDPFVELALPTGDIESAIGLNIYTYDFFSTFNDTADYELELYANASWGMFGLSGYYVPSQKSTKGELHSSCYWLECSVEKECLGATWNTQLGYGTYCSRYLSTPRKEPVGNLVLTATKSLGEGLDVSYGISLGLAKDMENIFVLSVSKSF